MDINDLLSNPLLLDELIKRIADEVIKRINNMPKKALVLISGGVIGYKESAEAVKRLVDDGWNINVFVTQAALDIFGESTLKDDLGVDKIYYEGTDYDAKALWSEADLIVIAEMTINTAAKISCGIADSELLTMVRNAIMGGKEIVAAVDGACPDNKVRAEMGMNKAPKPYRDMLHDNLVKLASFGIWLCNAEDLYETCKDDNRSKKKKTGEDKTKQGEVQQSITVTAAAQKARSSGNSKRIDKHVVSRRDILDNQASPSLLIPADALLTHSAADLADELGISIHRR